MSTIGQSERATQNRILALFHDELGYRCLGDWTDRPNNSNIEDGLLSAYLTNSGYSQGQISRALNRLRTEAGNPNRSLYDNNKETFFEYVESGDYENEDEKDMVFKYLL